jgi:hypothetical protein
MVFRYNRKKIPAGSYPEFPQMHHERSFVRRGRLSDEGYQALLSRLDSPEIFWLKAILVMTYRYGFRQADGREKALPRIRLELT